jgi:hypothetical protein
MHKVDAGWRREEGDMRRYWVRPGCRCEDKLCSGTEPAFGSGSLDEGWKGGR